ncbi:MAG TPA: hypothetical protein VKR23_16045 [Gaiellaceae bacterium]|nr:hypothetical protein [Gaiellaceae bacterium]
MPDRLDVHIYLHLDAGGCATLPVDQILAQLALLNGKADLMAKKESDLQTDLDTIRDGVASLLTAATANAQTIKDLQAQVAAGSPVTQDQLDALAAEADGIVATLTPLAPPASA